MDFSFLSGPWVFYPIPDVKTLLVSFFICLALSRLPFFRHKGAEFSTDSQGVRTETLFRTWRKSSRSILWTTVFTAIWCTICVSQFGVGFTGPQTINGISYDSFLDAILTDPLNLLLMIVPLCGIFFAYKTLGMWMNSTRFSVKNGKHLEVKIGPVR